MSSAKDYMNIVEVLSQLSEASKKVIGQINFDGMTSALKIVAEQLKPLESLQGNLNSALKVMQVQLILRVDILMAKRFVILILKCS